MIFGKGVRIVALKHLFKHRSRIFSLCLHARLRYDVSKMDTRRLLVTDHRSVVSAALITRIVGLPQRPSPDANHCFCLFLRVIVRAVPVFSLPVVRISIKVRG